MQISKKKIVVTLFVLTICYMYVVTLGTSFGFPIDFFGILERRAQLLGGIVILGVIEIVLGRYFRYDKTVLSGLFLMVYMFMLGFNHNSNFLAWLSCSVMWYFIFVIFYHLDISETDMQKYAVVFSVTSFLLSFLYLVGTITSGRVRTVANSNSIYYVLGAVPFLFVCKQRYIQWLGLLLSSAAVIISAKSTCLLAMLCIWIIFFLKIVCFENTGVIKIITNIVLIFVAIFVMWLGISAYTSSYSILDIFRNVFEELQSGGNGRFEIYRQAITAYMNSSLKGQIFGNGFNTINNTLGIGTHNDFLMVLYNYGMVGFVLYVAFWIQLVKNAVWFVKTKSKMSVPYVSSVVVFFWISMASNVLNTQIQFLLLCVLWGMISPKKIQNKVSGVTKGRSLL